MGMAKGTYTTYKNSHFTVCV